MAKSKKKPLSIRNVKLIVILIAFVVAGGYRYYTQNILENRAVLNWSFKQKIKPVNIKNVQENQLSQLNFKGDIIINVSNGKPTFTDQELELVEDWEEYQPLDDLRRATQANALLGQSLMPTKKRERLNYHPTGWHTYDVKYKNQTNRLYNRSHLIAYQLTAENDNPENLVTGTWQMNADAMEFYETELKYYLNQTNHHVRYQVTPIYRNQELIPRGVHMMARSIEDNAVSFNIYIFNVQPDVNIDYSTGLASGKALVYRGSDD